MGNLRDRIVAMLAEEIDDIEEEAIQHEKEWSDDQRAYIEGNIKKATEMLGNIDPAKSLIAEIQEPVTLLIRATAAGMSSFPSDVLEVMLKAAQVNEMLMAHEMHEKRSQN